VNAGFAVNNPGIPVSFPTDDSKASQLARINAALVTLQNLQGPGVGCPASSTTFVAQQSAIANGPGRRDAPPSPAAVAALAPSLGHQAGINPTGIFHLHIVIHALPHILQPGTGNCDGAVNGPNGLPIEVPCSCPPDQANFITVSNHSVVLSQPAVLISVSSGTAGKCSCWSRRQQSQCAVFVPSRWLDAFQDSSYPSFTRDATEPEWPWRRVSSLVNNSQCTSLFSLTFRMHAQGIFLLGTTRCSSVNGGYLVGR
jgi:hypothetical protein